MASGDDVEADRHAKIPIVVILAVEESEAA
jgi:hypothetical protein